MSYQTSSRKAALREVVEAVRIMGSGRGSSLADIYFVLDNLHGRKDKAKIRWAVKAAVIKGLLRQQNTRYKVNKSLQSVASFRMNTGARVAPIKDKHRTVQRARTIKSCLQQPRKVCNVKKTKPFTTCSCCFRDSVSNAASRQNLLVNQRPKGHGSVKYPLSKRKVKVDHKSSKSVHNKDGQRIVKNKAGTETVTSVKRGYSGMSIKKQSKKRITKTRTSTSDKSKSQALRKKGSKQKSSKITSSIKSNQNPIKTEKKSNHSKDSENRSSNYDHMYSSLKLL